LDIVLPIIGPVFGAVALGFLLFRVGLFDEATGDGLARFVYHVAIPALLFRSLAHADLPEVLPWNLILAFYLPSVLMFACGVWITRLGFAWDRASQGVAGMGACYSNMVMLGIPLTHAAFGASAAVPLYTLLALQSTVLFTLATWTIEVYGARGKGAHLPWYRALTRLFMNPVIPTLALGILANVSGLAPVGALDSLLEKLSAAAQGCALVSLGVSLAQYRIRGALGEALSLVVLKNALHPLLVWLGCTLLSVRHDWARVAVLLAAMPAGINGYVFAKRYRLREEVASKVIVLSTLAASVGASVVLGWAL